MVIKNLLVSLLLVAGLSSCGGKDGNKGAAGPVSDADGVWTSACADLSSLGGGSMKTGITVAAGGLAFSLSQYSDPACATMTALAVNTATFTTGVAVATPAGAKEYNSNATALTVTLFTDDAVTAANAGEGKICSGGFTKGQAKTFTAADCANDNENKDGFGERFSIYKVDGNNLYIGDCGDAGTATDCSAATKRPTALETTPYTRVGTTPGGGDGGGGGGTVSDADGVWTSTCQDISVPPVFTGSYKTGVTIAAGTGTISIMQHTDAACATLENLTVVTSTFITGAPVATPAGAKEYNSNSTAITVTLYTDDAVSKANTEGPTKICAGGFTKGVAKTFTAADCASDDSNKDLFGQDFSIYKVDGNKLYLGDCGEDGTATDCSAATKRPTSLATTPYTKV